MMNSDQTSPRKKILNSLTSADSAAGDEFDRIAMRGLGRRQSVQKDLRELDGRIVARWHRNLGVQITRAASLVLASMLLILAIWWLIPASAPNSDIAFQQLEGKLAQPLSTTPLSTIRNAVLKEGESKLLAEGLSLYEKGDFTGAAKKFELYQQQQPEAKEVKLFWGHSLLLTDPHRAEVVLRSLAADEDVDWAIVDQARYLLAWVYLRTDREAAAVYLLDSLQAASGNLQAEAERLLELISKNKL